MEKMELKGHMNYICIFQRNTIELCVHVLISVVFS